MVNCKSSKGTWCLSCIWIETAVRQVCDKRSRALSVCWSWAGLSLSVWTRQGLIGRVLSRLMRPVLLKMYQFQLVGLSIYFLPWDTCPCPLFKAESSWLFDNLLLRSWRVAFITVSRQEETLITLSRSKPRKVYLSVHTHSFHARIFSSLTQGLVLHSKLTLNQKYSHALVILLPPPLKAKIMCITTVYTMLGIKPWASCMLSKHSSHWARSQVLHCFLSFNVKNPWSDWLCNSCRDQDKEEFSI